MVSRRTIHIIFNPMAGRRRRSQLDRVVHYLTERGARVTVEPTAAPGHATDLARSAVSQGHADVVAAAGGDGTINEVARGLLGSAIPLGIVPLGTANVLAIEIGLLKKAGAVAETLLTGNAVLVGTGLVDGRIFLLMVGAGFDGMVVHRITPGQKRWLRKGAFIWHGAKLWAEGPARPLALEVDGKSVTAHWALITNARHYAGRFLLAPDATIAEPGLDGFFLLQGSRFAFAKALFSIGLGRARKNADLMHRSVKRVVLKAPPGLEVQIDGDARGGLPRVVEEGTKALRLVVPGTLGGRPGAPSGRR